jgi:hypothetical protein
LRPAAEGPHEDAPDIEFAATVKAEHLRFREVPRTEIRFSGTPNYESSTVSRRRNLPDRVSADVDYYDVRVDYLLINRLEDSNEPPRPRMPPPP